MVKAQSGQSGQSRSGQSDQKWSECSKVVKVIRVVVKELPSTKLQGIGMLPSNVIMTTPYRIAKVVKVVIKVKSGNLTRI